MISIVICVYNEEKNVRPLVEQITVAMEGYDYEIIYVDDGSKDGTLSELKSIRHERLKTIELRKNYGQSLALMAGIDVAKGEYIVTLDGDLQNDPSDIPTMLHLAGTYTALLSSHGDYGDLGAYYLSVRDLPAGWDAHNIGNVVDTGYSGYDPAPEPPPL